MLVLVVAVELTRTRSLRVSEARQCSGGLCLASWVMGAYREGCRFGRDVVNRQVCTNFMISALAVLAQPLLNIITCRSQSQPLLTVSPGTCQLPAVHGGFIRILCNAMEKQWLAVSIRACPPVFKRLTWTSLGAALP